MESEGRERRLTSEPAPDEPGGLAVLLETERELSTTLARAEEEALAIIEAARARAAEIAHEAQARLAAELVAVDAREETATTAALADADEEARAQVELLDGVPEERIDGLADEVLADFLGARTISGHA